MRICDKDFPKGSLPAAVLLVAVLLLLAGPADGEDSAVLGATAVKAAYASAPDSLGNRPGEALAQAADAIVFTAPPRETPEEGQQIYGPIAESLTRVTGHRIVYRHPQNWLSYQTEMLEGSYDLIFDGPHFNS